MDVLCRFKFYSFDLPCLFSCILLVIVFVRTFWFAAGSKARSRLDTGEERWDVAGTPRSRWNWTEWRWNTPRRSKDFIGFLNLKDWIELEIKLNILGELSCLKMRTLSRLVRPKNHDWSTVNPEATPTRNSDYIRSCSKVQVIYRVSATTSQQVQGLETHIFKLVESFKKLAHFQDCLSNDTKSRYHDTWRTWWISRFLQVMDRSLREEDKISARLIVEQSLFETWSTFTLYNTWPGLRCCILKFVCYSVTTPKCRHSKC